MQPIFHWYRADILLETKIQWGKKVRELHINDSTKKRNIIIEFKYMEVQTHGSTNTTRQGNTEERKPGKRERNYKEIRQQVR